MLLHPALAAEGAGDDMSGVVVAVAAQILDRDLRVGQALLDEPLDHCRVHRHRWFPVSSAPYSPAAKPRARPLVPRPIWHPPRGLSPPRRRRPLSPLSAPPGDR